MAGRWSQGRRRLASDHRWKAKPGHQILVLEAGAVRFDVPRGWVVVPSPSSMKICDRQPPDDECTLEVSYLRLPAVDLTGLSVGTMLRDLAEKEDRGRQTWTGEIVEETRGGLELAQRATRWIDATQLREACSHIALARRGGIQALLTYDYWLDDARQFGPVWLTVLETLRVAEWVTPDGRPASGPASAAPRRPRDPRIGRA